jgi:hypothetical protein
MRKRAANHLARLLDATQPNRRPLAIKLDFQSVGREDFLRRHPTVLSGFTLDRLSNSAHTDLTKVVWTSPR